MRGQQTAYVGGQVTDDLTLDASRIKEKGVGGRESKISQGPQVRQAPLIQDPQGRIRNNKREAGGRWPSGRTSRGLLDCLGLVAADPTRRLWFPKRVAVCVCALRASVGDLTDCGENRQAGSGFGGWDGRDRLAREGPGRRVHWACSSCAVRVPMRMLDCRWAIVSPPVIGWRRGVQDRTECRSEGRV